MKLSRIAVDRVVGEIAGARLGDERRRERLERMVAKMAKAPAASLPAALGSDAEVQAAYRLMNNSAVNFCDLLAPHLAATANRAKSVKNVLVLHDTTECSFADLDPNEIGSLNTGKAGFALHLSLVVDSDTWRRPLGIAHAEPMFKPQRSRVRNKKKRSGSQTTAQANNPFDRWWRGMQASATRLSACENVIHVADREGDSFELMSQLLEAKQRFIIRVRVGDRRGRQIEAQDTHWSTVGQIANSCSGIFERQVPLSRRKAKNLPEADKRNPPRKMRLANLRFSATTVLIPRPKYLRDPTPRQLRLNLIHVLEIDSPPNDKPVEWLLYTTEPIETPEQVANIVDNYRTRWAIEEFNAALKTGCAYEARQFESRHALLNVLAVSLPIACELLWLRSRARTHPDSPATDVLSSVQVDVLRELSPRTLSTQPTAEEALLAVAGLGGHLKRNGPPGWKVLHRGMVLLRAYEEGWRAHARARRSQKM